MVTTPENDFGCYWVQRASQLPHRRLSVPTRSVTHIALHHGTDARAMIQFVFASLVRMPLSPLSLAPN